MKIVNVKINQLKSAKYNPRKWSDEAVSNLKKSIKRFGLVDPIIANKAKSRYNIIIGGHFRIKIAKNLGYKEVPVVYVDIPNLKKEKELNLRLNKNLGEFDDDLLAEFDQDLLSDVGFSSEELDEIFDLNVEEDEFDADEEYDKIKKTKTKLGDLYELGQSRLI